MLRFPKVNPRVPANPNSDFSWFLLETIPIKRGGEVVGEERIYALRWNVNGDVLPLHLRHPSPHGPVRAPMSASVLHEYYSGRQFEGVAEINMPHVPVEVEAMLDEKTLSSWTDNEGYPSEYTKAWYKDPAKVLVRGESLQEVQSRALGIVSAFMKASPDGWR